MRRTCRPQLASVLGGACRAPAASLLPHRRALSAATPRTSPPSVALALPRTPGPQRLPLPRISVPPQALNVGPLLRRSFANDRTQKGTAQANKKGEGTAGKYVYNMYEVTKFIGHDRPLFKDITLSFYEGAKIGIIGVNGSGKSTLMKIIAGIDTEFDGEAAPVGGAKVGYLAQEPELDADKTVLENVMDGVADKTAIVQRLEEVTKELEASPEDAGLKKEKHALERRVEAGKLLDLPRRIDRAMDALRCPPPESPVTNLSAVSLTHGHKGERRRVALCRLLVSQPDILLLDEPTNHLDAESVAWLERFLQEYRGAVIAVTHDRYFLDNVAGWILELDRGQAIPFKGNYTAWMEAKEKRLIAEKRREAALQKSLKAELEWIRAAPRARQAKSKARVNAYELRVKESASYKHPEPGTIVIPRGPRLGKLVIEVSKLGKSFEDRVLFKDVSFTIPPGAIVGVIGPNGAGKTTLFNIIAGLEQPDEGEVRIGDTVEMGFVSQARAELDPERTVWEEITDGLEDIDLGGGNTISSRVYVAAFNFKGEQQNQLVGQCSGGERNRVHLAKMLKAGPNVLFLDEPTNDLDVEVLRNLENALQEFSGTAVVISHDRWFLDRLCTHIVAFEGDSRVIFFDGNYSEYEDDRAKRLGSRFDPHRVRYKKLGM